MKTITFKTLSILLAAVLLVAALPLAAFAEDASPCANLPCEHNYEVSYYVTYVPASNEIHYEKLMKVQTCIWCGDTSLSVESSLPEAHRFDYNIVDPEVDMQGVCINCGRTVYW